MRAKYVLVGIVIGVLLSSAVVALAGSLDPPSGPKDPASQMATLEQIYNRVNDGSVSRMVMAFAEPDSGPGSTMHTLDELYTLVGERARVPKTGQSESYGGGDDGDLEKGVNWPDPRFTDNGDGTVTDHLTGLMWLQDVHCMPIADWAPALANIGTDLNSGDDFDCYNYTAGTYDDWRMPNRWELESLLDLGEYNRALPDGHPFYSVTGTFWTSTPYAPDTDQVWIVDSFDGAVELRSTGLGQFSWPVRGGQ
jgi:hypothetical protein